MRVPSGRVAPPLISQREGTNAHPLISHGESYPTDSKERQKQLKAKEGISALPKSNKRKYPKAHEKHFDDCGECLDGLGFEKAYVDCFEVMPDDISERFTALVGDNAIFHAFPLYHPTLTSGLRLSFACIAIFMHSGFLIRSNWCWWTIRLAGENLGTISNFQLGFPNHMFCSFATFSI